jgi:hypothetical protein
VSGYVIDTNVWIECRDHYPPDVFPGVWDLFDDLLGGGELSCPQEVLIELQRGHDDLPTILAAKAGLFVPLDEILQDGVVELMDRYGERMVDPHSDRDRADPYVVALARIRDASVVCNERTGLPTKVKVPDACKDLGVPCVKLHDFFRQRGLRLK